MMETDPIRTRLSALIAWTTYRCWEVSCSAFLGILRICTLYPLVRDCLLNNRVSSQLLCQWMIFFQTRLKLLPACLTELITVALVLELFCYSSTKLL